MHTIRMNLLLGMVPVPRNTHMIEQHNMLVQITKKAMSMVQPISCPTKSAGALGGGSAAADGGGGAIAADALLEAAVLPLTAAEELATAPEAFTTCGWSRRSQVATWLASSITPHGRPGVRSPVAFETARTRMKQRTNLKMWIATVQLLYACMVHDVCAPARTGRIS